MQPQKTNKTHITPALPKSLAWGTGVNPFLKAVGQNSNSDHLLKVYNVTGPLLP